MATVPLGAELNLGIQVISLALILAGLRYAMLTHGAFAQGKEEGALFETKHKNLMTSAVLASGVGATVWMVPNLMLGWFYGPVDLGYGTGGYPSYFEFQGAHLPHWYLLSFMVVVGSITALLGVYLVLRMRWNGFPEALKIQNYRAVMIATWTLWFVNIVVGVIVFYFFAFLQTG